MTKYLITFSLLFHYYFLIGQNTNAELVNHNTIVTLKHGNLTKQISNEIRINNRKGEKYTEVSIPYSNLIRITKLEAYIKNKNGDIIKKLKKSDIRDKSSISDYSFYEDNFIKEFTLKHNSYPYTIYYEYQLQQDDFIFLDYWTPVIDVEIPTRNANLTLIIPKDYPFNYKNYNVSNCKIDSTKKTISYKWTSSYTNVIKPEIFSPPLLNFIPKVILIPRDFNYEIPGSFNSWQTYGNWQNEIIANLSELPPGEKQKIEKITQGISDRKEIIKRLFYFLQNETHYINVKIETGGLKPYPAAYVAENKYGDCKALTNYFKSVLDYVGIKSFYTKVNAGEPIERIDTEFPYQQFNHVILFIPSQNDTIWLDCTSDGPFNYLGTFTQNRNAFVIKHDSSLFVKTPILKAKDVLDSRHVRFNMLDANITYANFNNIYKGENFELLNYIDHSFSESEKQKIIRNNFIEESFELIDYMIINVSRDSNFIALNYNAKSSQIYSAYGNEIIIKILPFNIPNFEKPQNRKLPVQIDYPIFKTDTLEYLIPEGFEITKDLVGLEINNKYGKYGINYITDNNTIVIIKYLLIKSGNYETDEYFNFFSFINEINKNEKKSYIIIKRNNQ